VAASKHRILILLRSVNLGARNKVPMARLRQLMSDAGAEHVTTFIASGNVLCVPPGSVPSFLRVVEGLIADEFGVRTTAVSRTARELRSARAAYPFDVPDERLCAISFLQRKPTKAAAAALAESDLGADRAQVIGKELHLRYASGQHASRMTAPKLARLLGTDGTLRNLRTVDALINLLD
jgi:uncharacterized protein (DUF1697 family)